MQSKTHALPQALLCPAEDLSSHQREAGTRSQLGSRDGMNGKQHRKKFWASFLSNLLKKPATAAKVLISPVLVKYVTAFPTLLTQQSPAVSRAGSVSCCLAVNTLG